MLPSGGPHAFASFCSRILLCVRIWLARCVQQASYLGLPGTTDRTRSGRALAQYRTLARALWQNCGSGAGIGLGRGYWSSFGRCFSRNEGGLGTVHGRKNQSKMKLIPFCFSYPLAPPLPTPGSMLMDSAGCENKSAGVRSRFPDNIKLRGEGDGELITKDKRVAEVL